MDYGERRWINRIRKGQTIYLDPQSLWKSIVKEWTETTKTRIKIILFTHEIWSCDKVWPYIIPCRCTQWNNITRRILVTLGLARERKNQYTIARTDIDANIEAVTQYDLDSSWPLRPLYTQVNIQISNNKHLEGLQWITKIYYKWKLEEMERELEILLYTVYKLKSEVCGEIDIEDEIDVFMEDYLHNLEYNISYTDFIIRHRLAESSDYDKMLRILDKIMVLYRKYKALIISDKSVLQQIREDAIKAEDDENVSYIRNKLGKMWNPINDEQ